MAADGFRAARQARGSLKTTVRILRGPGRGRTGWIAGELERQNPHVTRVPVFLAGDVAIVRLDNLERADEQLQLTLSTK